MNYATIKEYDIANGPGVRTSLFVSGCTHHCKNCFNEIAWDFGYGDTFTVEIQQKIIDSCRPQYITGLSLLGGEPMEPENQAALLPFLERFKQEHPNKTIWCYSGYTYEQLTGTVESRAHAETTPALLNLIDVLVDGKFVQELYDITLRFRGSSNQRLIDLAKTRAAGEIVSWFDSELFNDHKVF